MDTISLLHRFLTATTEADVKPSWRTLRAWLQTHYPEAHDKDTLADEIWATTPSAEVW